MSPKNVTKFTILSLYVTIFPLNHGICRGHLFRSQYERFGWYGRRRYI